MKFAIPQKVADTCINTIKILSAEVVQKAKSGHPGMPLGCADIAFVLWAKFLNYWPQDPSWFNRDRFVLSAGHGSALLYVMLHLTGYKVSMEQLQAFRQLDSITPGHPEYGVTPGVETTAGPLGQGFANGVGMAIASRMMAARFNREGRNLIDHHIYGICSDGDLMEGVASEAASLAGHLGLGNLIYFYDDNRITIDGSTDLTFTEDRAKRFEAYGWLVQHIDGHNQGQIEAALRLAIREDTKPSLIVARTHIAHGAPTLQDSCDAHGSPLGADEIRSMKEAIGWPEEAFHVPEEVRQVFEERERGLSKVYRKSIDAVLEARKAEPELMVEWDTMWEKRLPEDLGEVLLSAIGKDPEATRVSSGKVLHAAAARLPGLCGGSADLTPSNKTFIKGASTIEKGDFGGRNFHFGVREHAMGSVCNGLALYGGWIPYAGTFLVFADYMRPAIRLAAIMGLQVVYVFTHDCIFVGEDGPTHQPVEQIASLRAMPGLLTIRPADPTETAAAWAVALQRKEGPTALFLTRQGVNVLDRSVYPSAENVKKGAYVLSDSKAPTDMLLIATGSEVHLALDVQAGLEEEGTHPRVISMPSMELFEKQDEAYKETVIPSGVKKRVVIEAGSPFGWDRYLHPQGLMIGMEGFGKSAPYKVLAEHFGFRKQEVMERIKKAFS